MTNRLRPRSRFGRRALAAALVRPALAVLIAPGSLRAATEKGAVVVDLVDARAAIATPYTLIHRERRAP
jgi:hypothetical protein